MQALKCDSASFSKAARAQLAIASCSGSGTVIAVLMLTVPRGDAGKVAQLAQGEIDRLAKAYGGRSVPAHVTLMGGIVDDKQGIYDRAALLSSQLKACHPFFPLTYLLETIQTSHLRPRRAPQLAAEGMSSGFRSLACLKQSNPPICDRAALLSSQLKACYSLHAH